MSIMDTSDRSSLDFVRHTRRAFEFLGELGFSEIEALSTLVRYRKFSVEVDVYHGRQSYEIGVGVTAFGTRYPISEIIRAEDPEAEKRFRYPATTTPEGVVAGLDKLSALLKRYGRLALDGDPQFFSKLEDQRTVWAKEYALDVLARQLRPKANEAFRKRDYATAADLYSRILKRLSPAELKKLDIAEDRRKG
jgi:hypothetical protein